MRAPTIIQIVKPCLKLWLSLTIALAFVAAIAQRIQVDGISFVEKDPVPWLPVREIAQIFSWPVEWDAQTEVVLLRGEPLDMAKVRWLVDGRTAIPVDELKHFGAAVGWDAETRSATVHEAGIELVVLVREKRAEISIADQKLRAWQGERLVFETNVSTGRRGHRTPTGDFSAKRKVRMHYSTRYNNAPMPWSVQIYGDIFLHGYHSVPSYPASRGCIRLPLKGRNPAKWFWDWVEIGTPISVVSKSSTSN